MMTLSLESWKSHGELASFVFVSFIFERMSLQLSHPLVTREATDFRRNRDLDEGMDEMHATRITEGEEERRREKGNCAEAAEGE